MGCRSNLLVVAIIWMVVFQRYLMKYVNVSFRAHSEGRPSNKERLTPTLQLSSYLDANITISSNLPSPSSFCRNFHSNHHRRMHRLKQSSFEIYKTLSSCRNLHYSTPKLFSNQQSHFKDVGSMASLLKSRSVIRFRGPDTIKFLQGLLTNDVRRFGKVIGEKTSTLVTPNLSTVSEPPLYAALLTPQGRFLYDLFLYRPPRSYEKLDRTGSGPGSESDETFELLADVDATVLDEVLNCFNKYRLRSKVDIENINEEFSCWQRFGGNLSSKSASTEEPEAAAVGWGGGSDSSAESASHGNSSGFQWYEDPRLQSLGFRGIFPSNTIPPLVESDKETNELNYLQWRVEKGIAEGSLEIPKGEAIPLEYNLTALNAISFDKGCYVGQEFVARTHHRGVIRKRLFPLKFIDKSGKELEQKVAPGSQVVDTSSNKKVGTVTTALGRRGLGLLRMEEAFGSGSLNIKEQDDVKIEVIRPDWWPSEWVSDHHHNQSTPVA